MSKVLVTGFDAFGKHQQNTSEVIIKHLAQLYGNQVVTAVLRTSYSASSASIRDLMITEYPDAVLLLGQAASTKCIRIERFARNRCSTSHVDNDGERGPNRIISEAPPIYPSTLPLKEITCRLHQAQIRYAVSTNAGSFVCNHAFFVASNQAREMGKMVSVGFMHVPAAGGFDRSSLHTSLIPGITIAIETLLEMPVLRPSA